MSAHETVANVPRGVRPELPPRPALEEDAFEQIRREQEKSKEREFVRFAFYKVDAAWRRLPPSERERQKAQLTQIIGEHGRKFMIYSYSLVSTRGDCDFLLWQATRNLDHFQALAAAVNSSARPKAVVMIFWTSALVAPTLCSRYSVISDAGMLPADRLSTTGQSMCRERANLIVPPILVKAANSRSVPTAK